MRLLKHWVADLTASPRMMLLYTENAAAIYSNSTPKPTLPYVNLTVNMYINGTDQFGNPYIFDPDNAYGFPNPNNFSGIAIPDVSEAELYYAIVALSARQVMGAYVLTITLATAMTTQIRSCSKRRFRQTGTYTQLMPCIRLCPSFYTPTRNC